MRILFVLIFLFSNYLSAQQINPIELRLSIYEHLINELKLINSSNPNKEIAIDPTLYNFEHVELTSLGVNFIEPIEKFDSGFCKLLSIGKCVNKSAIDQFDLKEILVNHNDQEYVDYFGIYSPVDHWYNYVTSLFNVSLQNQYPSSIELVFPVKHVYFKNKTAITEYLFYKYILDKDYKIVQYQKINIQ